MVPDWKVPAVAGEMQRLVQKVWAAVFTNREYDGA
jgi:hypothetical protein